jgi:hypothetical protein
MAQGTVSTDSDEPRGVSGPRANALEAAEFSALSAVDARVADALLDVLEDAGIAARIEPAALDQDTLYVDASRCADAQAVVAAELPGMLAELAAPSPNDWTDEDEAFAHIVAGFDADAPTGAGSASLPESPIAPHPIDDAWDTRIAANARALDEEDHFVPPPPPPMPRLSGPRLWGAVLLAASLLLLIVVPLTGRGSDRLLIFGILCAVAGTAIVVSQMRDGDRSDSDPDDGAVV